MPDLPPPEVRLASALQVIADLKLGQSQESLTEQLAEGIPILNALGLYDAADFVRRQISSGQPDSADADGLRRALAASQVRERELEQELVGVNRTLHEILGRPFKLRSVLPMQVALQAVAGLVRSKEKQRRTQQRRAQFALARIAELEGRKPVPGSVHAEAMIHRFAVAAGQDRATRKAAAERRRDSSSPIGRLMLRAGWFQVGS